MTELNWEGKYDQNGRRVAPLRIALPFQTVETVNESGQVRAHQLALFQQGKETDWRNRLIWGDKKYVLPSLLDEFAGKVNLIYIDPPFATGANFSFTTTIPESDEALEKAPSMIEQKAYRDMWGRGLDSYLQWFYETAVLLRDLLAEDGSLYVHLDENLSHYAKVILDEVFNVDNFRGEIIREKTNPKNYTRFGYGNIHDVIYFYSKSQACKWNKTYLERTEDKAQNDFPHIDTDGRRFKTAPLHAPGIRYGESGQPWRHLMPPPGNHWRYVHTTLDQLDTDGRIEWSSTGNPREKVFADESLGVFLQDIWMGLKDPKTDYPSAKNPELLDRIIRASSNEGDLVLDCFCGSGTTAAVAEMLGRRWITCDLGRFAIHTTRKRLLGIENVSPFVVQNLGKYERQEWQARRVRPAAMPGRAAKTQLAYRRFMLDLYHAQPIEGYTWLHGVRDGRLVHVGGVDAPVSDDDVRADRAKSSGRRAAARRAATASTCSAGTSPSRSTRSTSRSPPRTASRCSFKRIPREVLEKKAVEQGDIKFFELAALSARCQPACVATRSTRRGAPH